MSDPRSQRNLAVIVAVAAVAILIGFLIGRGGSNGAPAAPVAGAPTAAPADLPAVAERAYEPEPVAEAAPVARPSTGPSVPVAGQRSRAPRAETPAAAPAADAVDPAEDLYAAAETADGSAAAPATPTPAAAPIRVMTRVEIPEGTTIVLDLVGGLSSATAQVGDEVVAELAEPVRVNGRIVLPSGTRASGRVTEAQALKTVGGQSILGFVFDHVDSGDGGADISASFYREGKKETGKDAATIAGGAAAGAILGNQAKKNDRGKIIGAILGAAAGAAVASRTPGEVIELPDGARLELTLREPAHVLVERE